MADQVPFPALRRAALWLAVCGVPLSRPAPESSRAGHHVLSTVDDKSGASRRSQQYLLVWSDSLKLHSAVLGTNSLFLGTRVSLKLDSVVLGTKSLVFGTCAALKLDSIIPGTPINICELKLVTAVWMGLNGGVHCPKLFLRVRA